MVIFSDRQYCQTLASKKKGGSLHNLTDLNEDQMYVTYEILMDRTITNAHKQKTYIHTTMNGQGGTGKVS
jgi:hypothetical protein